VITEERLIGWLCMIDNQWSHDIPCFIPSEIGHALCAKGWIDVDAEPDWDGQRASRMLPAGAAIVDLNGAEWGMNMIPGESVA